MTEQNFARFVVRLAIPFHSPSVVPVHSRNTHYFEWMWNDKQKRTRDLGKLMDESGMRNGHFLNKGNDGEDGDVRGERL